MSVRSWAWLAVQVGAEGIVYLSEGWGLALAFLVLACAAELATPALEDWRIRIAVAS